MEIHASTQQYKHIPMKLQSVFKLTVSINDSAPKSGGNTPTNISKSKMTLNEGHA